MEGRKEGRKEGRNEVRKEGRIGSPIGQGELFKSHSFADSTIQIILSPLFLMKNKKSCHIGGL